MYDNFVSMAQIPYMLTDVHWWGGCDRAADCLFNSSN